MAVYPNGIVASSTGAYRGVSGVPILTSRAVWYVSSTHARTSDANPGTEEEEPLATLAQGITNASSGDIILVMANHVEVGDHDLNLDGLLVIGQGTTTTRPKFSGAADSATYCFTLSKAGAMIRNLRIWGGDQTEQASPTGLVGISITGCVVEDCELNLGTLVGDTADAPVPSPLAILLGGTAARATIRNNVIYNRLLDEVEDGATDLPYIGIHFTVPAVGTRIIGNTINGGTQGFDAGAIHVPNGIAVTDLYLQGNTFSNGADVLTAGTGSIRFWGYGNTFNVGSRFSNDSNRFRLYENGLAASDEVGHPGLVDAGLMHSGNIFFLDSSNANAEDSPAGEGTIRNRPLKTLAQAQTNLTASNGDIVVIEKGHRETLRAPLVLTKSAVYLGMGTGDDRALFTLADLATTPFTTPANLFGISGANVWMGNFRITSTCATATHTELIQMANVGQVIENVDFEQGLRDEYAIATTALASEAWIRSNTFTRIALPAAAVENHAIGLGHTAEGFTVVEDNSLDPTSDYFWGSTTRLKGGITDMSATMASVHILGNILLNGADVFMQNNRVYLIADSVQNAGSSGHT